MRKRMFCLALVVAQLFSFPITVHAEEQTVEVATGSALQVTTTSFEVDENVIGGGVVVTVPTNLALAYDEEAEAYIGTGYVSAKGTISSKQYVEVSIDPTIIYQNLDVEGVFVEGSVNFGTEGVEVWTAEEVKASLDNLDKRPVTITVPKTVLDTVGSYESELIFNIELVDTPQE